MVADAGRRGYTHLLDGFWAQAEDLELDLPAPTPVSGAAFCRARNKLHPDLLRELIVEASAAFQEEFGATTRWKNRRLLAVDGCRVNLQRGWKLHGAFATPKGAHCPQALCSVLFDVLARIPQDVGLTSCFGSERELLSTHLDLLRSGDVLILDRGYPSYAVIRSLVDGPADFALRLPVSSTFASVEEFIRNGDPEGPVELTLPAIEEGQSKIRVTLRTARLEGPDGVPMILLTSLTQSEASTEDLRHLYKLRWEIETFFGLSKGEYLDQGQFHARNAIGVEQEIYALFLFISLSRFLMAGAADKYAIDPHELSMKAGILNVADKLVPLLLITDAEPLEQLLAKLYARIARRRDKRRSGRSFSRRSFLPSRKWGSEGRRGGG